MAASRHFARILLRRGRAYGLPGYANYLHMTCIRPYKRKSIIPGDFGVPGPGCHGSMLHCEDLQRSELAVTEAGRLSLSRGGGSLRPDPNAVSGAHTRLQEDGVTWLPVYKTNVVNNCLKPVWKDVNVRAAQLNNGDIYRPLRLQVWRDGPAVAP